MMDPIELMSQINELKRQIENLKTQFSGFTYYPIASPFYAYESGGTQWINIVRNIGTYRFNMTDANNALPDEVIAVYLQCAFKWAAAADGTFFYTREYLATAGQIAMRSIAANITMNAAGIQTLDSANHAFEVIIAGANTTAAAVVVLGFFS